MSLAGIFVTDFSPQLTGGLVHRAGVSSSGTGASNSGDSEASGLGDRDPDCPDQDDGYEGAEDSKAVRLSLMEEVLLLGIKDREVQFTQLAPSFDG